jgi:predicted metal-dependent enzyme (double-stranded beta helix superfamily)
MSATATNHLPAFDRFIQQLREVWASISDVETRMKRAEILLKETLADPAIIAHSKQWPWTPGQNLLLYEDPDHHFVINATVRKPGSKGAVHDHGHSWTLYGLVEGTERIERYARLDDRSRAGYAELKLVADREMGPGGVDFVPPFEVHAERGGAGRSVAIIVRSERMVGRFKQHMFDLDNNAVAEAWGPEQIPYQLA